MAGLSRPLVTKILSCDGAHKSDFGGVRLNLDTAADIRAALEEIGDAAAHAGIATNGFLVEEQSSPGVEMVLGGLWDPRFGPCVMVGLGGVFVEVFEDVAFRTCPISTDDARDMIRSLRAAPLLRGARGAPPCDEEAVIAALVALGGTGGLMEALDGQATEIDINPLIVRPEGATAVDARIILRPEASHTPPAPRTLDSDAINRAFRPLFQPSSIAVLGASATGATFGNEVIRHSLAYGYSGTIHPVHRKAAEVEGFPAAKSLANLPVASWETPTKRPGRLRLKDSLVAI